MNWEPVRQIVGKAAFAGLYAAVAELALTQTLDKDTLFIAIGAAVLRGIAVFAKELHDAWKPKKLESRLESLKLRILDLL